jgi:hypothetical protein
MNNRTIQASVAALVLSTAAGLATARDDDHRRSDPLEGTWRVRVTPYVCNSDPIVSFPQFAVDSYLAFGAGGTLVETNSNARFMPGQRSTGLGHWERTGRRTYAAALEAFIQFSTEPPTPTSPYVRGTQRVDQEIEFVDGGRWNSAADRWTSVAVVTFRDVSGKQVPPSGCAIAEAVRMP